MAAAAIGDAELGSRRRPAQSPRPYQARGDSRRRRCRHRSGWSRCRSRSPHCRRWSAHRHKLPPKRSSAARSACGGGAGPIAAKASRAVPARLAGASIVSGERRRAALSRRGASSRPAMNGSVSCPMNMVIALNVLCCTPVAVSPEICVSAFLSGVPSRLSRTSKPAGGVAPPEHGPVDAGGDARLVAARARRQDDLAGVEHQIDVVRRRRSDADCAPGGSCR